MSPAHIGIYCRWTIVFFDFQLDNYHALRTIHREAKMNTVNKNPSARDLRKFAFTMIVGMPIVGAVWTGIIWWSQDILNLWILGSFAIFGATVCSVTLLSRSADRIIYIFWHTLAAIIETIISFVSTLLMYLLTILPIGIIMRIIGRKPLTQLDKKAGTYWKESKETTDLKRYFRQY